MPTWADFEPVEASSDSTNTWKDFEPHHEQPHLETPKFEPPAPPPLTAQEEKDALAPWYQPPTEFGESLLGIKPESVPTAETPLGAVGRAAEKTALGIGKFVTSPSGIIQIGASLTPAAPVVYAKWAYDMIRGGIGSIKQAKEDLKTLITDHFTQEVAGRNNLPYYSDDPNRQKELIQSLADNAVNIAASAIGTAGAVKGGIKSAGKLLPKLEPEKGVPDASQVGETTPVYGDVREQSVEGVREVPVQEGGAGVQPQPETLPQLQEKVLSPEEQAAESSRLAQELGPEVAKTPQGPPKPEEAAPIPTSEETPPEAKSGVFSSPAVQKVKQTLDTYRGGIVSAITARPERHAMDQTFSAADNQARILGRSTANHVSIGTSDIEQKAASAVIAAGFDKKKLGELLSGKNKDADAAIKYAQDNWEKVVPIAERGKEVFDNTYMDLNNHSIPVEYAENYLPGLVDTDVWMGQGRPYVIRGRGGSGAPGTTGFQKGKTYPTPFDAIKDGQTVKSIKLSELVENYVTNAQKLMNRAEWADSLRDVKDPNNQQPIVTSLIKHVRGEGRPAWEAPPTGYVRRTVLPGVDIAVHEGYARLFDALTGRSVIAEFEPGGIPVGVVALQGAGLIKHGLLAFDTFHASRILQKYAFLTGQLLSSKKGLALLDYADRDLDRAVAAKEITPEIADYVRQNRPTADLLIKNGLPVGRIQQALYTSVVRKIPIIGEFNKWVFEKATRSAIMQAGLLEFERVKRSSPELSDTAVAQKVSRDLGAYFGNLDKQGIFKSATLNDLSHLIWMAPQWVEAMARSEVGGAVQLGKGLANPLMGQAIKIGTLGAGLGKGLIAYFLATQLLNLATRKQFTWQNQEEGHKLDAWIPDITGKTPGYFISPFSVVAELTHDAIRYSQTEPDALAVAGRILANKSSSLVRAARALGGRDWNDQKLVGSWNKVKAAAWALAPTPIPLQPIVKGAPAGQAQRQLTGSLGFKTEPAPTAQQQIYSLVDQWKAQNRDPRYRRQLERKEAEQRAPSDYKPLKQALINRDQKTAEQEYTKLRESGKTLDQIQREFESPRPFTGSSSGDADFKKTLTPQQRELFRAAETERKELAQKFKEMLRKRP